MIIDFKEIPIANKGGGEQDRFEQFACDLIAAYGLLIFKFIYRESKRNVNSDLAEYVLEQYNHLEQTLDRPERNDLEDAKELLRAFKNDLDSYDLSFPLFSNHLSKKFIKT